MLTVSTPVSVPPLPSLTVYSICTGPVTLAAGVKFSVPLGLTVTVPSAGSTVAPVRVSASPSTSVSLASTGMPDSGVLIGVLATSSVATGASLTAPTLTVTVAVDVPPLPSLTV
jgi:hypothetical protein